ncbi:MAG: T9SS type A sorting domain-containing protein [Elusimicrobiales bacterium]
MWKRTSAGRVPLIRISTWTGRAGLVCFIALFFYKAAGAILASPTYRILISEQTMVGNTSAKTGGAYSLLGSSGQLGYGTIGSSRYTLNWSVVNSWRPPQDTMATSHVYPNPCDLSKGCTGVTFTRLTAKATVRIYTLSGELVRTIEKSSNIDSEGWDLKNSAGRQVAGGLYIYFNQGGGSTKKGKLIIIR